MNIKRADDKPMVIHTKEKPKLHVKGAPGTKIRGRNALAVRRGPKISGTAAGSGKIKLKKSSVHAADKRKTVRTKAALSGMAYKGRYSSGQDRRGGRDADTSTQGRQGKEQGVWQSVNRENRRYA